MDDSESTTDSDAKAPDGGLLAWFRDSWRRLAGPPPQLLVSDIVSPDAQPICPRCIIPHHRVASVCSHCDEIVSPWASCMAFVWIFVWGRGLHRVMGQARWSRLVVAGMLMSAVGFLGCSAVLAGADIVPLEDTASPWVVRGWQAVVWVGLGAAYAGAGLRMLGAAVKRWGTWRDDGAVEKQRDVSEWRN